MPDEVEERDSTDAERCVRLSPRIPPFLSILDRFKGGSIACSPLTTMDIVIADTFDKTKTLLFDWQKARDEDSSVQISLPSVLCSLDRLGSWMARAPTSKNDLARNRLVAGYQGEINDRYNRCCKKFRRLVPFNGPSKTDEMACLEI